MEKDALSRLVQVAARPYGVSVVVARGFSSVSYIHECAERIRRAHQRTGQDTKILYFGDFDPPATKCCRR